MHADRASHNNLPLNYHPKFSIHIALQLIGLTTEKLLPMALSYYGTLCIAWDTLTANTAIVAYNDYTVWYTHQ